MNNTAECYKALLGGETLITKVTKLKVKLDVDGNLIDASDGIAEHNDFSVSEEWEIYKEPKWYENIPEGGVLCSCTKSFDSGRFLRLIEGKNSNRLYVDNCGGEWMAATPLTKQEIQTFMDSAPENKDE